MNIAIASGKGGTGKTTIATNLAMHVAGKKDDLVYYIDCDVEEPNGHLFLHPVINETDVATVPIPIIDESKCNACGRCVGVCEYKAIVRLGEMVMVFPELCHGCGGCTIVCPKDAITERTKEIGVVEIGHAEGVGFVHGRLEIGEAMSPPLIRKVLSHAAADGVNIIDAPPGTSCPVIAAIRNTDFIVLVTEPTPFGLNDLGLAIDMVRELDIPYGVVVNRAEEGNYDAQTFCAQRNADIIAEFPDDRRIAETYSRGEMIVSTLPELREQFDTLWKMVRKQVRI